MESPQDVVHVWWARLSYAHDGLVSLLDSTERRRHARYRRREDADRFLLGCAVTRRAAAGYLGARPTEIRINRQCAGCARPHGKPRLPDTALEVSVAHSGDQVGVAFHQGSPLGVDVERVPASDVGALLDQVLTAEEARTLRALPTEQQQPAFLRYWTRKEAVVKATGDGLSAPLTELTVSPYDHPPALLAWPARPDLVGALRLHDLSGDDRHVAALAVLGQRDVTVRELDARPLLGA